MRRLPVTRFWLTALLLLIALAPMQGLQPPRGLAAGGTTITMFAGPYTPTAWTHPTAQHPTAVNALRVLAAQFQKMTGITVKFTQSSATGGDITTYNPWLQANIAAGTAPDIIYDPQGYDFSRNGWVLPLDTYLSRPNPYGNTKISWSASFWKQTLSQTIGVNNHYYQVPIGSNYPQVVVGIFYDKDLLAKAGITSFATTWSGWMQQLARLKAAGIQPLAPCSSTCTEWTYWSTLMWPLLGYLAPKLDTNHDGIISTQEIEEAWVNGTMSMHLPAMQEMFRLLKQMVSYFASGWQTADLQTLWNTGKLAEIYGGYWQLPTVKSNTAITFQWGFAPPVLLDKSASKFVTYTPSRLPMGDARFELAKTADTYAVVKTAVAKDNNLAAVIKWLQFISAPQQDAFIVNENQTEIPAVRGAPFASVWDSLNSVPVYNFAGKWGGNLDPFAENTGTWLSSYIDEYVTGRLTESQFVADMQASALQDAKRYLASVKQ